MAYDKQILQIFTEVGTRGISAALLSKHVYNMNSTLFEQPDIQKVVKEVKSFVIRKSQSKHPILERTGRWGFYRLNSKGRIVARQLLLEAQNGDEATEKEDTKPPQDFSLSLFDDL
jgi:hypothetical protein